MTVPYYSDDWLTILQGDVRDVLPTLAADSVDCIVTSPPYWGLRDYGTASWSGGDAECDHASAKLKSRYDYDLSKAQTGTHGGAKEGTDQARWRDSCPSCGATRSDGQIGLERTPEEYVANMVGVFRELRRVLKPSGTCWLNLGDSYGHGTDATRKRSMTSTKVSDAQHDAQGGRHGGMAKQLVGIPWRVAFALQADGWYLRSEITWCKPNAMPESVTDRPTSATEKLFLMTKRPVYYFDATAVREQQVSDHASGNGFKRDQRLSYRDQDGVRGNDEQWQPSSAGRNIRNWWVIPSRPYKGAHFAVFPPELPERCIKAGSSELGTVLDPFAGSGTTGMVANRLSRRAILIDLNGDYLKQQLQRNAQTPLGLGAA